MIALRQMHLDSTLDQFLPATGREAPPDGSVAVDECEVAHVGGQTRTQSYPTIIAENSIEFPQKIDMVRINIIMNTSVCDISKFFGEIAEQLRRLHHCEQQPARDPEEPIVMSNDRRFH